MDFGMWKVFFALAQGQKLTLFSSEKNLLAMCMGIKVLLLV
jgi:hypothetical protein